MAHLLDDVDLRLICLLQGDGRRSNVEMAQELNLAEATVRRRLDRLLSEGALRIAAVVDPGKTGLTTAAVIMVQVDLARVDETARQIAALPEVQTLNITTGRWDIIAQAVFPSDQHLLSFLRDRVASIAGVRRTETSHVLRQVKHLGKWTLPLELISPAASAVEPEMLHQAELLAGLDDEAAALIANAARLRTFEAGTRVYSEGEAAKELYIVQKGRVAILVDVGQGRQAVLETVGERGTFGWPALIAPHTYIDTARCVERTTLIEVPTATLRELCLVDCSMCFVVMEKTASLISASLKDSRFQLVHVLQADRE
ncbi:MAG: cyclic nucleotide-binding domain-containing protein [Chloroflexota bacterium]|nr:cyclic nucleotide-binding domain-containing protein [Chloroflexota bacterium]